MSISTGKIGLGIMIGLTILSFIWKITILFLVIFVLYRLVKKYIFPEKDNAWKRWEQ